ncbi:MAG: hypothetical protein ACYC6G_18005 [Desulfobaccales bacterium]
MPRFVRYVFTAALLGLLGASPPSAGAQTLSPGAEVFAVDPAKVIEVTYRSPGMMLIAHRWQTRDKFTLIILDKQNNKPVTCLAGPGFDVVLNQLTSLNLRRALKAKEAKEILKKNPVNLWAEVVVRDNTAVEPFRALVMPVPGVPNEAFVQFNGVTYVVDFADQVSKLISSGCNLLATSSPNQE